MSRPATDMRRTWAAEARRGLLGPGAFITIAERCGLIETLDMQVLGAACELLAQWAQQPYSAGLSLSVNLSARLLYQADFVEALQREVLEETGVAAVFQGWFAMRHHHQGQFGASNLYLVARLTSQQTDVSPDLHEIAEAAWFDPQAFLADPLAHPYNKLLVQGALDSLRT